MQALRLSSKVQFSWEKDMGLHRVEVLDVEVQPPGSLPESDVPTLWTRGGINSLQIWHNNEIIRIPRKTILQLVAEDIRNKAISDLEQMEYDELIKRMFKT